MSSSEPCVQNQVENGISELKLLLCLKIGAQARLTEHAYESGQKWREVFWSKEGRGWAFKDGLNLDREKEPQREGGEEKRAVEGGDGGIAGGRGGTREGQEREGRRGEAGEGWTSGTS